MSTDRKFAISASVAEHEKTPPDDVICGRYFLSAYDAAVNYAGLWLPGYKVISCKYSRVLETEEHGLHTIYKAELVNSDATYGDFLYVREL